MEIWNIPTAREFIRAWRSEPVTRQIRMLTMAFESQKAAAGLVPHTIISRRRTKTERDHTAASIVLFREAVRLSDLLASLPR